MSFMQPAFIQAENCAMKAQLQSAEQLQTTIEALRAQLNAVGKAHTEASQLRNELSTSETALLAAEKEISLLKGANAIVQRSCDRCVMLLSWRCAYA